MSKSKKKVRLSHKSRYQRPVLTDVLPFEVPPSFSNGGFFNFLAKFNVRIENKGKDFWVRWEAPDDIADAVISILFKVGDKSAGSFSCFEEIYDGNVVHVRRWHIGSNWTFPFNFKISHKEADFRQLSIVHPQNQLLVAHFYHEHAEQIIYQCEKSNFSIRRPASIAKTVHFQDRIFQHRNAGKPDGVEEYDKEYENIGSYFSYKKYNNIFKFYENYAYLNAERKFSNLAKLDISGCFDSIYTHSIVWSTIGHEAAKENLKSISKTFGDKFDTLLQCMNRGETNGIVIGPEFSRIFAEIILQEVDRKLEIVLDCEHKFKNRVDYELFRYVDDYFVFTNDSTVSNLIQAHLAVFLRDVKLRLNGQKTENFSRPIITPLTIAKNKVSSIISNQIIFTELQKLDPSDETKAVKHYIFSVHTKDLIVDFKAAIYESGIKYKDILNYTLATVEKRARRLFDFYEKNKPEYRDERSLIKAATGLLEFAFFIYAAEPRVNFSVRLTRIVSEVIDRIHQLGIHRELKEQICKFCFDNIFRHIKHTPHDKFHEVETLYLLLSLDKLGRPYSISQSVLAKFLGISEDEKGNFFRSRRMTYFAISVCLLYIRGRKKYNSLRSFIENEIWNKFIQRSTYVRTDAELVIAAVDLQSCEYISLDLRDKIASIYGVSPIGAKSIRAISLHWFTNWKGFDLSLELDKKRARESY